MGRSTQATTLASGGAGRFTAAMGNPWTMIISTAAVVLMPLIENLFETEDAAKAAEQASNGLSDPQNALGQIFDLTTEKRWEKHTYELQALADISYDVFCVKKNKRMKSIHQST